VERLVVCLGGKTLLDAGKNDDIGKKGFVDVNEECSCQYGVCSEKRKGERGKVMLSYFPAPWLLPPTRFMMKLFESAGATADRWRVFARCPCRRSELIRK